MATPEVRRTDLPERHGIDNPYEIAFTILVSHLDLGDVLLQGPAPEQDDPAPCDRPNPNGRRALFAGQPPPKPPVPYRS